MTEAAKRLLADIRELARNITSRIAEIEAGRRILLDLVDALRSIGVFRMFAPQSHGGLELDLPTALEIIAALGRIDGSVGWTAMIGSGGDIFASLLPRETYEQVYPDVIIGGSAQPAGTAEAVAGGWQVGYLGLIRCPAMWGLFVSQGCLVYSVYLYMTWLPNYLQTARGLSLVGSGIFTSIPFFAASVVNIIANWSGDRLLSAEGVRSGKRRYLVALCLLLTATGLAIPFAQSLTAVVILVSIAASFGNVGPAANGALAICCALRPMLESEMHLLRHDGDASDRW
jgi:hypothetical protein